MVRMIFMPSESAERSKYHDYENGFLKRVRVEGRATPLCICPRLLWSFWWFFFVFLTVCLWSMINHAYSFGHGSLFPSRFMNSNVQVLVLFLSLLGVSSSSSTNWNPFYESYYWSSIVITEWLSPQMRNLVGSVLLHPSCHAHSILQLPCTSIHILLGQTELYHQKTRPVDRLVALT